MYRLLALLIGYAIGCIQTAYFVGKIHGIDIRDHGSKSAGMTNVTRTLGKKAGAFVFVVDILKAAAAYALATWLLGGEGTFFYYIAECRDYDLAEHHDCICRAAKIMCDRWYTVGVLPGLYAGLGAVLGHCFPMHLKFRGGKGVACMLGILFMLDWRVAIISYVLGFIAVCATRYISLASLIITLAAAISTTVFAAWGVAFIRHPVEIVILMFGLAALIWYMHRENIKRILSGNERKFLEKKKET